MKLSLGGATSTRMFMGTETSRKTQDDHSYKMNTIQIKDSDKKRTNYIDRLMKMKDNLTERKDKISELASKNGTDPKVTRERLDEIDAQIEKIDAQMRAFEVKEQKEKMGIVDLEKQKEIEEEKKEKHEKVNEKTDEENQELKNVELLKSNMSLKEVEKLNAIRIDMINERRIVGSSSSSSSSSDYKQNRAKKLEEGIEKISVKIGEKLGELNKKEKLDTYRKHMNYKDKKDKAPGSTDSEKNIEEADEMDNLKIAETVEDDKRDHQ